ncbi:MAG: AMP-binding protein, partial [Muribaculaceae bacterium]|nr:AMP-binding protein [Muribaculaceae bacterium]
YADNGIWENLDPQKIPNILGALQIGDFSLLFSRSEELTNTRAHLNEIFGQRYPERFTPDSLKFYDDKPEELVLINYTSGSTGFSKGVMLPYRVLLSNVRFCLDNIPYLNPGDGIVSMLPMAHMYGLTIEIMFPLVVGCHIYFLTRVPSPKVIMDAFAQVKPKLIITVPLIIEKIIKTKVFPLLEKPLMKLLLHLPFVDDRLLHRIKEQLTVTFGGQVREVIIGGAALNKEVENFLRRIGFPFTVGYGMTECGPLIAYASAATSRTLSCGRVVDRMKIKVDSPDPFTVPGVLWVKGDNVMHGYYKNPEATESAMADGWLNTGDICTIDADNYIYLRGRDKNMILGPSGQNIYPEEIEQKLNNMPYVNESIVIAEDGDLVALIYPDFENADEQGIDEKALDQLMSENITNLNRELPAYSLVKRFRIYHEEFEKTPKRSIKRYLYQRK